MKTPFWFALVAAGAVGGSPATAEPVRLVTLDPGHFHAALFQKEMLPGVDSRVHVYAPLGPDLLAHLGRVHGFNSRAERPTQWQLEVHAGGDSLQRLLAERPGNVVVVSGNNQGKIARLEALVGAGFHLLADKPWIIEPEELPALARTLELARAKRVAAWDAMTQRYEISCLLQKALVADAAVFGTPLPGTEQEPAVYMESVHFLKKEVAGAPLLRPAWFFDPRQQGEPLADVGTHLVDLVQWTLSPERAVDDRTDLAVRYGRRDLLVISPAQFRAVTGLAEFPAALRDQVRDGHLHYVASNTVGYTLRGVHVKLDVIWRFEAPAGGKDTELAVFRGSRARVEVRQGRAENFVPEVYVVANRAADTAGVAEALRKRVAALASTWPGLAVAAESGGLRVVIPAALRESHEAHFALLVRQFLAYQQDPGRMPAWETPYMLAKYRVTTEGVRLGRLAANSPSNHESSNLPPGGDALRRRDDAAGR
ncbi:MAG: oxidoreductase [Verrucomicrobia bacterium]|nr:oxidoreductase [Verrucomicrobiota bacterium]